MTQKQILEIAANEDAMFLLQEIAYIQRNMCYKTIYEQKTAKAKMKNKAKEIMEVLKNV